MTMERFNNEIEKFISLHYQDRNRLIKALKHLKSHLIFHAQDSRRGYTVERQHLVLLCQIIRKIDNLSNREIRLSLPDAWITK